jgi:hypothetical protein
VLTFAITGSDNIKEETSEVATSEGSHGSSHLKSQATLSKSSGKKRRRRPELEGIVLFLNVTEVQTYRWHCRRWGS